MALISTLVAKLRHDPRPLYKLPPYISVLLVLVGVIWLLLLPLNEYSRETYISENALLPGQVHTYFAGSEQNIFRAYRQELDTVKDLDYTFVSEKLQSVFRESGLKVATQNYEYQSSGNIHTGQNVYSVIHAPRGDGTEAIVLVAAWKTVDGELNLHGVALALTLARYFKRWSLWSKDIIFLITPDSKSGAQAWVDAYHDMHPPSVQSLPLKSGAIQGAIAFEHPQNHRFESLHILYDGVNGQLPNLDLFNTAIAIARGQMGIPVDLQHVWNHDNKYRKRLQTMLKGMVRQGLGHAAGVHSSFIPYHIDAITFQTIGQGWEDEMALGRSIEGLVRSINNLLEHFHQSFFFYLLMHSKRFVSIGTYLPSAMLIAGNFTIMAIGLWLKSGRRTINTTSDLLSASLTDNSKLNKEKRGSTTIAVDGSNGAVERHLSLPLALVLGLHFLGAIPLYAFNSLPRQFLSYAAYIFAVSNIAIPLVIAVLVVRFLRPTTQQFILAKSFSLVLLGLFLSALATLNFSLSLLLGLICTPLTFIGYIEPSHPVSKPTQDSKVKRVQTEAEITARSVLVIKTAFGILLLNLLSPMALLLGICLANGISVELVLSEAAFGWNVWGMWTQVAIWCIWWPAWLTGYVLNFSSIL
ncbi:Glycosyl phosphatidyl inositol protein transamidase complex subunit [Microsporum canis]|uniref:Rhomboid protein 2 n=1 Tax=Arthroderma otae (strain ATCC MYA-4605 / CBS 113480) TaxID=554155 RepID=C5FL32_ARTOC|nr:rhomboid protein 2 [Microsporum canis CBS 113480]EEQ30404.1 rhomboid protein 2 [Microsporum canis CBS 113480]